MDLIYLVKGKFSVLAEIRKNQDGTEFIPIIEQFQNAENNHKASIDGFTKLFDLYSKNGPTGLTYNWFHKPGDQGENLYQFIKGRLRLLCFYNENEDAVILSHYEIKQGRKLSEKVLNRARKIRTRYYLELEQEKVTTKEIL